MNIIENCSNYLATKLQIALGETEDQKEIYDYALQGITGEIVKLLIIIPGAMLLDILLPTVIIMITFATFRMVAGGFHMDTWGKCLAISCIWFLGTAYVVKMVNLNNSIISLVLTVLAYIITLILVARYAPKDTPNKPIKKQKDINKYKKKSIVYCFIWLIATIISIYINKNIITLSLISGLLIEVLTITPGGVKILEKINNFKIQR